MILYTMPKGIMSNDGHTSDFWCMSLTYYTCIILIINIEILMRTKYWTFLFWFIVFLSILLYIILVAIFDHLDFVLTFQTLAILLTTP